MRLFIFCHPPFLSSQSMPRFAQMLRASFEAQGYEVRMSAPRARFHKLFASTRFAKWAGYIDQYLIFPLQVRKDLSSAPSDTLFVFADQALGPWMPLLKGRPHVVHVHDLLNLRSALGGESSGHVTPFSGRLYQRYIRRGFRARVTSFPCRRKPATTCTNMVKCKRPPPRWSTTVWFFPTDP
jgi:hypothetical protein